MADEGPILVTPLDLKGGVQARAGELLDELLLPHVQEATGRPKV